MSICGRPPLCVAPENGVSHPLTYQVESVDFAES